MKYLHTSKKMSRNRKLFRIFVNGQEAPKVRSCKLGLRGWVEFIYLDKNGVRTKRIKNVIVNAVAIK